MNHHPYRPRWLGGNRTLGRQKPQAEQDGRTQRVSRWLVQPHEDTDLDTDDGPMGLAGALMWVGLLAFLCFSPTIFGGL